MAQIDIQGRRHRVRVDHDLCMGNRVCETHLDQVFRVDDDTNLASTVDGQLPEALLQAVREAIADCPQDAIILEPID